MFPRTIPYCLTTLLATPLSNNPHSEDLHSSRYYIIKDHSPDKEIVSLDGAFYIQQRSKGDAQRWLAPEPKSATKIRLGDAIVLDRAMLDTKGSHDAR